MINVEYADTGTHFDIINKKNSRTLWYSHSIINLTEEDKIEQNNNISWKRWNEPDR